jgi:hypothetical protein
MGSAPRPVGAGLPTAILAALLALGSGTTPVGAQTPPQVDPVAAEEAAKKAAAAEEAAKEAAAAEEAAKEVVAEGASGSEEIVLTSTEQGQTPLSESFDNRTRQEWIRETRREAFGDTKFDVQLRSFYLDRDKFDGGELNSFALGGYAGLKTGYFRERIALGGTLYTSQRLAGDEDKDGAGLLAPGQQGYTVLGELYTEIIVAEGVSATIGRRAIDTPYINRNDTRMTPQTFEYVALQGVVGDAGAPMLNYGFGYFDEIKVKNSDEFVSMSEQAGAPDGVDEGVFVGGGTYRHGNFTIGAVDYYSDDIINIFYTESTFAFPVSDQVKLKFAVQYTDQTSTGDDLLTGDDFDAASFGFKGEVAVGPTLFTAAWTSTDDGTSIKSPWGGYPGYTSVQVEDFNRTGEDAWMLRAAYAFPADTGLSVYALYVDGSRPDDPALFAKDEYDLNLQWTPRIAWARGLSLRLRYARVEQDDPGNTELDDFRFILNYDPPGL